MSLGGEGLDACTQDLSKDGGVVENQANNHGLELTRGENQQDKQHHEDHGHAAEELKHYLRGNPDPGNQGNTQQAERDAQGGKAITAATAAAAKVERMPWPIRFQTSGAMGP